MVPHLHITLIFQQGISIESEPQQLLGVSLLKQNKIAVDKEGGGGGRDIANFNPIYKKNDN